MTTFKFNFSNNETELQQGNLVLFSEEPSDSITFNFKSDQCLVGLFGADKNNEEIVWFECEKIIPDKQMQDIVDLVSHARMFTCGDVEIGHVVASEALSKMYTGDKHDNAVKLAEKGHCDLVAGKYEGGLKIWECTNDLIEYLENCNDLNFQNKRVLDLGCGAGILGIYAFLKESFVTFQDYNKEILECVTIPNVLLNIEEDEENMNINKCQFYSGDWGSFNKKLTDTEVFDIILTSETIYNISNYDKLIDLFLKRLSKDGEVYVAAKNCYFGVGGGTRQFEASIKENGQLESNILWKSSGGILREILKITKKT